jgi:hypothetical protein
MSSGPSTPTWWNSVMTWVVGLMRPMASEPRSVNQRLPSGPLVIATGKSMPAVV